MGAHSLTRRGSPPGAQGHTPFFYQNSGACHTQKGSLRGGDRDRAKGSRNAKSQTGFPGGAQAKSTAEARADVDGADGESLPEKLNNGAPLLVVYREEREFVLTEGSKRRPKRRLKLM